jgi:hypothetical protein
MKIKNLSGLYWFIIFCQLEDLFCFCQINVSLNLLRKTHHLNRNNDLFFLNSIDIILLILETYWFRHGRFKKY